MTNHELVALLKGLYAVQELPGLKFALVVMKNQRVLKTELEDLEELSKPSEDFMKLSQEVAALGQDQDAIKELEKKNKKVIDVRKKQMDEVNKILPDSQEIELWCVAEDILPDEINATQLNGLFPILL